MGELGWHDVLIAVAVLLVREAVPSLWRRWRRR